MHRRRSKSKTPSRRKLIVQIQVAADQAEAAKNAAQAAKALFKQAKQNFKDAKRAAKTAKKAVKTLKRQLKGLVVKARRPVAKRTPKAPPVESTAVENSAEPTDTPVSSPVDPLPTPTERETPTAKA